MGKLAGHSRLGLQNIRSYSIRISEVLYLHLQGRQKHQVSLDSFRILDYEADEDRRGIRESVYICMLNPDLNRDGSYHQLPHVWNSIFQAYDHE